MTRDEQKSEVRNQERKAGSEKQMLFILTPDSWLLTPESGLEEPQVQGAGAALRP